MHALTRYLRNAIDAQGITQADFARRSGLSTQRVNQIYMDDRDRLPGVLKSGTIAALAQGLGVDPSTVTAVMFEAMGYDLGVVRSQVDLSSASSEEILRALADRLGIDPSAADQRAGGSGGDTAAKTPPGSPGPGSNVTYIPGWHGHAPPGTERGAADDGPEGPAGSDQSEPDVPDDDGRGDG